MHILVIIISSPLKTIILVCVAFTFMENSATVLLRLYTEYYRSLHTWLQGSDHSK
jgi:hypothetical protein